MDYILIFLIATFCFAIFTGKPIKIEIMHKQEIPEAVLLETTVPKEEEEMKNNALDVMAKFNKEWSGVEYGEE